MNVKIKIIISNFIKQKFPIKRVRGDKAKWVRVIIIPSGYIRQEQINYPISKSQHNHESISYDIIKTICYVFGINQKYIEPLVHEYIKSIKI